MPVPVFKMATIGILPSFLKTAYYRMTGAKIGRDVKIGMFSIITAKEIEIGDGTRIAPLCFINVRKLKLGKRVSIRMMSAIDTGEVVAGDDSIIAENVTIGGNLTPQSKLILGKRVHIQIYCVLNPSFPITIGDDSAVGGNSYVFTHASHLSVLEGFPRVEGAVSIGEKCYVGWHTFIHAGSSIGDRCFISSGSVVTGDIPSGSLASGSPAKVVVENGAYIRRFSQEKKKRIITDILKSYSEYLVYIDRKSEFKNLDNQVVVSVDNKFSILFAENVEDVDPNSHEMFISFLPMSDATRGKLVTARKLWFDIGGLRTKLSKHKLWVEVRRFFSRYGIRFEIDD